MNYIHYQCVFIHCVTCITFSLKHCQISQTGILAQQMNLVPVSQIKTIKPMFGHVL